MNCSRLCVKAANLGITDVECHLSLSELRSVLTTVLVVLYKEHLEVPTGRGRVIRAGWTTWTTRAATLVIML